MARVNLAAIFEEHWAATAQAILACHAEPQPHSVHALRTRTRRLGAVLTKLAEDHPKAEALQRDAKRAQRQLKKLRQMAGVARDLDVHRKLLAELPAAQKRTHSDEISRLDAWLQKRRDRAAEALRSQLHKREAKLERALEDVQSHLGHLTAKEKSPSTTARLWFARATAKSITGDPEELHSFRKETKAARYLAEFESSSPAAVHFAEDLHQLQDAIGAWHDWDLLTQEAKRALPKKAALPDLLRSCCENALAAALRATHKAQPKRSAKKTA